MSGVLYSATPSLWRAELLSQGSWFSGKCRSRIDKKAGSRRDFRAAVPSAAFPGRLPATSSTSLVRDAAPGRKLPGLGPTERELQVRIRCVHLLAAVSERTRCVARTARRLTEDWVSDSEGSAKRGYEAAVTLGSDSEGTVTER